MEHKNAIHLDFLPNRVQIRWSIKDGAASVLFSEFSTIPVDFYEVKNVHSAIYSWDPVVLIYSSVLKIQTSMVL